MQNYPQQIDEKTVVDAVRKIAQLRSDDVTDRNNFPKIFVLGRKVNRTPSSAIDVLSTDNLGDINVTTTFAYYLVSDAGTHKWARWAVDVAW